MKSPKFYVLGLILVFIFLLFVISMSPWDVNAQDDGQPTPPPPIDLSIYEEFYQEASVTTGSAAWTLDNRAFTSYYPNGFEFVIQVTSTGGDITNASVEWSHVARQKRNQTAEYDADQGVFRVRWDGFGSIPPWVAVNYRWFFRDSADNTYQTEWFLGDEYSASTGTWKRTESEDIIVFVEQGVAANATDQIIQAMAAQRETYRQAWGDVLPYKPRVMVFNSRNSFLEWQQNSMQSDTQIAVGLTDERWGGTAQFLYGSVRDLAWGVVLHEVGHLYQKTFASAGFAAGTWWTEGNATLFEIEHGYDIEGRVRRLASRDELPALLQGTGPGVNSRGPDGMIRFGYDVGYAFWRWLVDIYGLEAHREVTQRMRFTSYSLNEALTEVLGKPTEDIESEWRLWLGASPTPPTLIPTLPYRFPPTRTPFPTPKSQ